MIRSIAALSFAAVVASCADQRSTVSPISGQRADISEARFGGNPEFFFSAPLATTPQAEDPNFDVGASHPSLVPYLRVCETNGAAGPEGCLVDVTEAATGSAIGAALNYSSFAEHYRYNWLTTALDPAKDYRIEIWGAAIGTPAEKAALDPRWLFGWVDIRHSPSWTTCTGAEAYCLIPFGQTLPVKVRIERNVYCPAAQNCAVQFVASGTDASFNVPLDPGSGAPSAQLFIPAQAGTNFALAFEPCTPEEDAAVSNAVDIPTFGPCLKTSTTFTGALSVPAIVSLCNDLDAGSFGLSASQTAQLALHHLSSDLARVTALPEAWACTQPATGAGGGRLPGNPLLRLARSAGERLAALVGPRPLIAATARVDRGGGGATLFIASFFKLALPARFEYEAAADAARTGLAGQSHTLRARVTDLFGAPVSGARVHWSVVGSPAPGASLTAPTPQLTDAAGVAQMTVATSTSMGYNVFHATGRGIAAAGASDCATVSPTTASCNGPRAGVDPFLPIHAPEFDPSGTEAPVDIAEGTRLPFSVFGCVLGFGAPVVDGEFSAAEWQCARTYAFTANVSGGSTPATLYVMNDGTKLYMAVRLARSAKDKVSKLQVNFDNNDSWSSSGTGAAETGDDVLSFDATLGFTDAHLPSKCVNSSQSSCWSADAILGGTNDGSGAFGNAAGYTTYELSHPLSTGDAGRDFSLGAGSTVGLFLTLQTGSGAAGNTQWPGFRRFLRVSIGP